MTQPQIPAVHPGKTAPDVIDKTILTMLGSTPPATLHEIAAVVKRSHVTVRQRVAWLIREGYAQRVGAKGSRRSVILDVKGFQFLWPGKYGRPGEPLKQPKG